MSSASSGLKIDIVRESSVVTLAVGGDLDMATAPTLVEAAAEVLGAGEGTDLVVDLAQTGFCDSAGIAALVSLRRLADQYGRRLSVANPRLPVRRVLELTGLMTHLNVT